MTPLITLPAARDGAIARCGKQTIYTASHGQRLFSFAALQSDIAVGQIDAAGLQHMFDERWPGAMLHYLSPEEGGCEQMMDAILMALEFGEQTQGGQHA